MESVRPRTQFFEAFRRDKVDALPDDPFASALKTCNAQLAVSLIAASLSGLEEELSELVDLHKIPPNSGHAMLRTLIITQGQLRAFKSAFPDPTIFYRR